MRSAYTGEVNVFSFITGISDIHDELLIFLTKILMTEIILTHVTYKFKIDRNNIDTHNIEA